MTDLEAIRQALERLQLQPDDAVRAIARRALDELARLLAVPIVFRSPAPGRFVVGPLGEERALECKFNGMSLAWMAIASGSCDVRDFHLAEAKDPVSALRESVRGPCAAWAINVAGCPELQAALLRIRFVGSRAVFDRRTDGPEFLTDAAGLFLTSATDPQRPAAVTVRP